MERRLLNNRRTGNTESGVSTNGVTVVSGLSSLAYLQPAVYLESPTEFHILPDNRGDERTLEDVKMARLARHRFKNVGALECCVNLAILELAGNYITDLQPLSRCTRLLKLDVSRNQVDHIPSAKFWAGYKRLRVLCLHDNNMGDLDEALALSAAPRLSVLSLMNTPLAVHPDYRPAMIRALPRLLALDRHVVTEQEALGMPTVPYHVGCSRFAPLSSAQVLPTYTLCRRDATWKQEARALFAFLVDVHILRAKVSPVHTLQRAWRQHRHRHRHIAARPTAPSAATHPSHDAMNAPLHDTDSLDMQDFPSGSPDVLSDDDGDSGSGGDGLAFAAGVNSHVVDNVKLLASLDRKILRCATPAADAPPLLRQLSAVSMAGPAFPATAGDAGALVPKWRVRLGVGLMGPSPLTQAMAASSAPTLAVPLPVDLARRAGLKRSELLSVSVSDLPSAGAPRGSLSSHSSTSLMSLPSAADGAASSDDRAVVLGPLRQATVPARLLVPPHERRRNSWDGGRQGAELLIPGTLLPGLNHNARAAVDVERKRYGDLKQRMIDGRRGSVDIHLDATLTLTRPPARSSSRPNSRPSSPPTL